MAEENKSCGPALFLAGLSVGALVGILYAPKSGCETRKQLANRVREGTKCLRTRGQQAAEEIGALVDKSGKQVNRYVDSIRAAGERGPAQWDEYGDCGKSPVAEQTGQVAAAVDAGPQAYRTTIVQDDSAER